MKQKAISYAVNAGIVLVVAALLAWYRGLFAAETPGDALGVLSDCFFVPGVVFTGAGLLGRASVTGVYDMLGFGSGRVFRWLIPMMDKHKYDDFYEYKRQKDERGRKWKPQVLICGLASLLLAAAAYTGFCLL